MEINRPETPVQFPAIAVVIIYTLLGLGASFLGSHVFELNVFRPFPEQSGELETDLIIGTLLGISVVFLSQLMNRSFQWSQRLTAQLKSILGQITRRDALVLAIMSSVGEEILFRGLLLPTMGLFTSSILFGIAHGISPGSPGGTASHLKQFYPLVIAAIIMGFAFGICVNYTGNIFGAIIAHFTINLLNLSYMYQNEWEGSVESNDN
jgi:hypothetical protein